LKVSIANDVASEVAKVIERIESVRRC